MDACFRTMGRRCHVHGPRNATPNLLEQLLQGQADAWIARSVRLPSENIGRKRDQSGQWKLGTALGKSGGYLAGRHPQDSTRVMASRPHQFLRSALQQIAEQNLEFRRHARIRLRADRRSDCANTPRGWRGWLDRCRLRFQSEPAGGVASARRRRRRCGGRAWQIASVPEKLIEQTHGPATIACNAWPM